MAVQRSEHDNKYDRQMRLWGGHGQRCIEEAHICVLGANGLASEVLKDLVLPNIGEFTVVDDQNVTEADCGSNFFVTQDDIGKNRGETVTNWLLEMNPDVKGHSINKSYQTVIGDEDCSFFDQFTLVIATQLFSDNLHKKLAAYLSTKQIPYMYVSINGLIATLRIQIGEIDIIETHPSNDRTDLYIYPDQLEIFPELKEYINSYDLTTKDVEKAAHLPGIAILGQFTQKWIKEKGGLPSSMSEKNEFKSELRSMGDGENYDDAHHWAFQCYNKPRIDQSVRKVLSDPAGETLNKDSNEYWVLVRALRDFMENEGKGFLPVSTNTPDFHTDPESYVTLKRIYQARYETDLGVFTGYVKKRLTELSREETSISSEVIERFMKHCRDLKVVRTRSVEQEYTSPDLEHIEEQYFDMSMFEEVKDDGPDVPKPYNPKIINWYFALRVCNKFYDENNRLPGDIEDESKRAEDVKRLTELQKELFTSLKLDKEIEIPCLEEMVRFGGSEMHNMASLMGGVAAGSAMKILMKQFFPLNHTYLYNGIHCAGEVYQI